MNIVSEKNAERFKGFADIYENARPAMPFYPVKVIKKYLGKVPELVVDLGCGTGLSTIIWQDNCVGAIGVDPNKDMLKIALAKQNDHIIFQNGFSHKTNIDDNCVDAVICSQSFHWMEPVATLNEINRILKNGGVFTTVDCDWPPVSNWKVEKAYTELFIKVLEIESSHESLRDSFVRYSKDKHLANIHNSGHFSYTRELVFANTEKCSAKRLINLALSQGGLQSILKEEPEAIRTNVDEFIALVNETFGDTEFEIEFSYRMRLGIK